jgi:hypothetical protein
VSKKKNYQKGLLRGRQGFKLKAARKTLAAAWSPDLIAKVTGLPVETIKGLKNRQQP